MFTSAIDLDPRHTELSPSDTESVRRTAFYLESQGQPLFAWLHHRVEPTGFDHGVIICPPVGYEQLRELAAAALAEAKATGRNRCTIKVID